MKRSNPWALPRVQERRFERTFEDPEQEEPLTLTLRRPDPMVFSGYMEQATEWAKIYAAGVPTPDGDLYPVPENQWFIIASLMAADAPEEGEQPYTELEWIGISLRYPNAWLPICSWLPEVTGIKAVRDDEGNSPAAPAKP